MIFFTDKESYLNGTPNINFAGCYVLFDRKDNPIYAGMSQNIQRRLKTHTHKKKIFNLTDRVKIQATMVNQRGCRLMTEARLIKWYRPKLNIRHNPDINLPPGQMELFKI